ncbi:MAG: DNA repair exonuclease [Schaedlerella sp.]|nr:DNA repair exonuclease [Schaedlerella sp.]
MRFIHIADVHLGAGPEAGKAYTGKRPQELWDTFEKVLKVCEKEKTDLLLIAGDLFHKQPLLRELKEVDYLFSKLTHTKVVMIAGNHDFIRKDSYYKTFVWSENVYTLFRKEPEAVYFPELRTAVYGMSYHSREIIEPLYDNLYAHNKAKYEILLAHGGDEKHIPIRRTTFSDKGFDYIALGHIHRRQVIENHRAEYAGSLEPTDKNDTGHHGFVRGEITDQGVWTEFVPFSKREYLHMTVPVNEHMTEYELRDVMKTLIMNNGIQHIYRFILRGERSLDLDLSEDLSETFDNVIEIVDETMVALDIERIHRQNKNNLIGRYIETFGAYEEGSLAYEALCEGLRALLRQ